VTRPPELDREAALLIDVDGTLLEIAARPELVEVPPGLPDLLRCGGWPASAPARWR